MDKTSEYTPDNNQISRSYKERNDEKYIIEVFNPSKSTPEAEEWLKKVNLTAQKHALLYPGTFPEDIRKGINVFYFSNNPKKVMSFREELIGKGLAKKTLLFYQKADEKTYVL